MDPPTSSPTLPLWDGVGCPDLYETHTIYHENDRVIGADGYVYQCKVYPYSGSCGQQGFEPGESSSSWSVAWDRLGSCEGTIAPTSSPNYNLNVVGGCPGEYTKEGVYDEGDMVSLNGIVYKCNPFPFSAWCSHDDYAPDSKAGEDAWEVLGLCEGTMAPTSSPNFDTLGDVAGCPGAWDESVDYEGGEKVTLFIEEGRGVVYDCASDWRELLTLYLLLVYYKLNHVHSSGTYHHSKSLKCYHSRFRILQSHSARPPLRTRLDTPWLLLWNRCSHNLSRFCGSSRHGRLSPGILLFLHLRTR